MLFGGVKGTLNYWSTIYKKMESRYIFIILYCSVEKLLSRGDYRKDKLRHSSWEPIDFYTAVDLIGRELPADANQIEVIPCLSPVRWHTGWWLNNVSSRLLIIVMGIATNGATVWNLLYFGDYSSVSAQSFAGFFSMGYTMLNTGDNPLTGIGYSE